MNSIITFSKLFEASNRCDNLTLDGLSVENTISCIKFLMFINILNNEHDIVLNLFSLYITIKNYHNKLCDKAKTEYHKYSELFKELIHDIQIDRKNAIENDNEVLLNKLDDIAKYIMSDEKHLDFVRNHLND